MILNEINTTIVTMQKITSMGVRTKVEVQILSWITIIGLLLLSSACGLNNTGETASIATDTLTIDQGRSLFALHCSACHSFRQEGIGPQLGGLTKLVSPDWILNFIKNPQAFIDTGDQRALELYDRFHTIMPGFAHLPDQNIEEIIAFLHTQKAAPVRESSGKFEFLSNPLPDSVLLDDLVVDLKLVCQIPPSSEKMPRTRIAKLAPQPSTQTLFVVDLRGQLFSINEKTPQLYLDIAKKPNFIHKPGLATGFGSFAFHPKWAENGLLYTTHTENSSAGKADFGYADSIPITVQWVLSEWKTSQPESPILKGKSRELMRINMVTGIHGMQEITFNPLAKPGDQDYGLLYIGVGDGGSVEQGYTHLTQSRERIWGTILRIDPLGNDSANGKYGIPVDNPWSNSLEHKVLREVYAFGFRNPHRISWSQTGLMLATNIGQKQIEAVYQIQPGGNHGWPIREGTFMINPADDLNKVYPLPTDDQLYQVVYPIAQYDHDEGTAISGGYEYRGTDLPELLGKYFFGDITSGRLFYINLSEVQLGKQVEIKEWQVSFEGEVISLKDLCKNKRVDLRFGRDSLGELYLFTKPDGKIYQFVGAVRSGLDRTTLN